MEMRRYIRFVLLTFCLAFVCAGPATAGVHSSDEEERSAAAFFATENSKSLAMLTDTSHLLRICSSRPERVNTSKEPDVWHMGGRFPHLYVSVKIPSKHYGHRHRNLSCRLLSMPPCDYYVFMLRQLLC